MHLPDVEKELVIPSLKASSQRKIPLLMGSYAHTAGSLQGPNGKFLHKANPKGLTYFSVEVIYAFRSETDKVRKEYRAIKTKLANVILWRNFSLLP